MPFWAQYAQKGMSVGSGPATAQAERRDHHQPWPKPRDHDRPGRPSPGITTGLRYVTAVTQLRRRCDIENKSVQGRRGPTGTGRYGKTGCFMTVGRFTCKAATSKAFAGLVALAAFTLVALGTSPAATADTVVNPGGNFNAAITGGQIKIGSDLDPIDVGQMNPAPRLRNVTVAADGSFTAAAADLTFPRIVLPVDSPVGPVDIFVQIRADQPVTGTIDPATGAVTLSTALTIQLTSNHAIVALGNNCYVGRPGDAIPFEASAGPGKGIPYDEYTGQARIDEDTLAIPSATGCPTILGNDVNQIVNDELNLPSPSGQNLVQLALRFSPMPHSEDWVDPEGPGSIDPVIVNDAGVDTGDGDIQRS